MDIKELLDQFTLFDPAKGQRAELPAVEGNYIVVLKAGCPHVANKIGNLQHRKVFVFELIDDALVVVLTCLPDKLYATFFYDVQVLQDTFVDGSCT